MELTPQAHRLLDLLVLAPEAMGLKMVPQCAECSEVRS